MPDPPPTTLADSWPATGFSAFICFIRWTPQGRQRCPQSLGVGRARGAGHQGTAESPAWVLCAATAPGLDSFGADCLSSQVMPHLSVTRCVRFYAEVTVMKRPGDHNNNSLLILHNNITNTLWLPCMAGWFAYVLQPSDVLPCCLVAEKTARYALRAMYLRLAW